MLLARLVLRQSITVLVVAEKSELKALTPLDGVGYRRPSHNQPVVLDAGQVLELFELPDECFLVCCGDFGSKAKEYWIR